MKNNFFYGYLFGVLAMGVQYAVQTATHSVMYGTLAMLPIIIIAYTLDYKYFLG